jgi:hypothetical protein
LLTRGRASARAALRVFTPIVVVSSAAAQPVRTRDLSYSAAHYEDGRYTSALTFDQSLFITRDRSSTLADGVVSIFDDGRWSMSGELSGARYSKSIPIPELVLPFATDYYVPFFHAIRGEMSLMASGSAQQGLMPTLHLLPQARLHFLDLQRGVWLGGGFARTFDGDAWRTTVLGDLGAWVRWGGTVVTASAHPQQLQNGDLMSDLGATVDRTLGPVSLSGTFGWRTGQADRVDLGWVSVGATFSINRRLLATASVGNYPADLLQRLPGARFVSLSIRLPSRSVFPRRDDRLTKAVQETPAADGVILRIASTDSSRSGAARVVRVRAPASERVEIMADFTDWLPVTLVRTPEGVWEITVPVIRGSHRLNVRLDGGEWIVPTNVARVTDEFGGVVGLVLVR